MTGSSHALSVTSFVTCSHLARRISLGLIRVIRSSEKPDRPQASRAEPTECLDVVVLLQVVPVRVIVAQAGAPTCMTCQPSHGPWLSLAPLLFTSEYEEAVDTLCSPEYRERQCLVST